MNGIVAVLAVRSPWSAWIAFSGDKDRPDTRMCLVLFVVRVA